MNITIIPATDLIDGQCVRLTQGDYASRKTYYRDPLDAALRFEQAGIRRLHMVDLDGAKASEPRNLRVLERVATRTSLEVQYGGGAGSFLLNILWLILSGLPLAIEHCVLGTLLCVTIIGIPFGLQHFKLAKLALMPFGAEVY